MYYCIFKVKSPANTQLMEAKGERSVPLRRMGLQSQAGGGCKGCGVEWREQGLQDTPGQRQKLREARRRTPLGSGLNGTRPPSGGRFGGAQTGLVRSLGVCRP